MRRSLASVVLGFLAFGVSPERAAAASPAITSAEVLARIQSHVSISKAIDPSRSIHSVADDVHTIDKSATHGITEFDETVRSYAEDPGGPTILLPDLVHGFDPTRPADGTIGKFSGTSEVSQHTTVSVTADTASVRSSANLVCRKTRIPNNALMAPFSSGSASAGVIIQIARPCRYSFTATVSADHDDLEFGSARVLVAIQGNDPQVFSNGARDVFVETNETTHAPTTNSLHLTGVLQPGFVEVHMSAQIDQSGPEGRASWSVTLELSPDGPSDDIRWTKASGGGFGATANWDPPQVPLKDASHTDNAIFDLNRTYTVDFAVTKAAAPRTSDRLLVERGHVTFENANYTVDNLSRAEPSLSVDVGTLTLASGNLTTNSATIGDLHSVGAEVEVAGQGSRWDCLGELRVGGSTGGSGAAGTLTITGGGTVTSAESLVGAGGGKVVPSAPAQTGDASVDGTGSTWTTGNIAVGYSSIGVVSVTHGAKVSSDATFVGLGVEGTANIVGRDAAGTRSEWSGGALRLGPSFGLVHVFEGGVLRVGDVSLESGYLFVSTAPSGGGSASLFTCTSLDIGDAALFVQDGAQAFVAVGGTAVGLDTGPGLLALRGKDPTTGAPSKFETDESLWIGLGDGGIGTLSVNSGARAVSHDDLNVAADGRSIGAVIISGGSTVRVDHNVFVGDPGTGIVVLDASTLDVGAQTCVANGSSVQGSGTIVTATLCADGFISPNVRLVGAPPAPKRASPRSSKTPVPPAGTLTIQGDLVVGPTGVVTAEAVAAQSDKLIVTGSATLDGTLVLQFKNGFAPKTGDAFELVHVNGTVTGAFATVETRGLAAGAQFEVTTTGGAYKATAMNDTVALPTVSVKASPKKLLEKKPKKKGVLTFTRQGSTAAPLTVSYTVGGTAVNGVDCVQLLGTVTFPAKKKSVKVAVAVARDPFVEGTETLQVAVDSGADYTASVASTATIAIVDSPPR